LDRHRVVKVIFEYVISFVWDFLPHQPLSWVHRGDRAVGIEYVSDIVGRNGGTTTPIAVRASRLVVLSAGAFGSPAILERSGIGAKSVLEKCGIKQRVDLPGVGEHYMGALSKIKPCSCSYF
jgi:alcohol oxidase